MSRRWKIAGIVVGGLAALALVLVIGGIYVAQTDWLRERVRTSLLTTMETATGGKVEIGKFQFDWKTLTAELDDFVIHGTEPASGPPLLRIPKLVVGFKIISLARRDFDVASVRVDSPQAYLLVAADGSTNIPSPKVPSTNKKSSAETILDLKIGAFSLLNGSAEVHAAGEPPKTASYEAVGRQLESKFTYEAIGAKYRGSLSVEPLTARYGDYRPTDISVKLAMAIEKNRLQILDAKVTTAGSHVDFSGLVDGFIAPVITAKFDGDVSLRELNSILKLKPTQTGDVRLSGNARYTGAKDYLVSGNLSTKNFGFSQNGLKLANVRADSDFRMDREAVALTKLRVGALGGTITGKAWLRHFDEFELSGMLQHFDVGRLAALESDQKLPYDGVIGGPFSVKGRLSDKKNQSLVASANLAVSPAPAGMPVNGQIQARYEGSANDIVLGDSYLALPNTRLDLAGVLGQKMQVRIESRNLDDLLPALAASGQKTIPVTLQPGSNPGSLRFDGTVMGSLDSPRLDGHVEGHNFIYSSELVNSLTADITALETGASIRGANLVYKDVQATFQGSVGLRNWKADDDRPVAGSATLQNAAVTDLLRLAGRKDIPVTGTLSVTTQISGTVGDLQAAANLTVLNGSAYGEPFDRVTGKLEYQNGGTQTATIQVKAGPRQIDVNARYQHVPNDFGTGQLHFELASNRIALGQLVTVKKFQPKLAGNAQVTAKGDVAVSKGVVKIGKIDADAKGAAIMLDTLQLGDAHLTAHSDGQTLNAHVDSNLAQAEIKGAGTWKLTGDYPGSAEVTFAKVDLAMVRRTLIPAKAGQSFDLTGSTAGKLTINGPMLKPEALTGSLEIPQLEVKPGPAASLNKELSDLTLRNTEPIRISMANSIVRVESARFTALNTDLALLGSIELKQKNALNLNLNGKADLRLIHSFNSDIESSGSLAVRVTIRGSLDAPKLGGSADLRNGNVSIAGIPNGLSNATGRIVFDENRVNIENLNATTGGGNLRLDGFAAWSGSLLSFRLQAAAKAVRVRYPEGVSSVSDANLTWTGTSERSVLGGDVTVQKVSYNPQSDLSSVLALGGAGPTASQSAPTGILAGLQFDIRVQTAPGISFQTGLVSGLETEANLRLRGSLGSPALLGRINISSGNITFFGNKYVISQGSISFFNPAKIDPILNIDLETKARGVSLTLTVSGPLSKLNVTYQSDPPLQFNEIVGLLTTGAVPSDPTLAARQTDTQQSWTQLGASALVGQAIANPVSGRLQRFLGVSRLKIDPLLPGLGGAGSGTVGAGAGARVSMEQQITPNVLFDYVISTNSTSSQIVRVEWAFNKSWSAVVIREENSAFGIDFQYKKRFK
jgi:translocation and assembly module TamB